ncbi:type II secretion system F family protein [bacterium]|jgi:type IV pilus assembly protein PilC|nr:type II secretion system F family protein [bacterium]
MPRYSYSAKDRSGKGVNGTLEANNEGELRMQLRSKGLRPLRIAEAGVTNMDIGEYLNRVTGGATSVPIDKLMNFIKQLQTMISSGVPLIQAIDLFYDQESHPYLKSILGTCREKINGGSFLWEAFSMFPGTFERVFVALVRAGEASGTLDVMLKRVGRYLEYSFRLKRLIKSSMNYPITIVLIAMGVISLMLTVVIPKFETMLTSNGQKLPAPTQFVIDLSHAVTDHIFAIIAVIIAGFFILRGYFRSQEGTIVLQRVAMRIPVFGNLIIQSGVARFSRTLSTLLASGVPLVDSLEICQQAASHIAFEDAIGMMKSEVELGATFSNAMVRQSTLFPKMAVQMTLVGESTGNLDKMLERVAEYYEEEVEVSVQGMLKLIEPVMLVVMGGIVGGLLISMYLPVFQMAGSTGEN